MFSLPQRHPIFKEPSISKRSLGWQPCGARRGKTEGREESCEVPQSAVTSDKASNAARPVLWKNTTYLCQLLFRRKPQTKHRVGSAVGPLSKLLRRFGESHVGRDCAVYNHLQEKSPESRNVSTERDTTAAAHKVFPRQSQDQTLKAAPFTLVPGS